MTSASVCRLKKKKRNSILPAIRDSVGGNLLKVCKLFSFIIFIQCYLAKMWVVVNNYNHGLEFIIISHLLFNKFTLNICSTFADFKHPREGSRPNIQLHLRERPFFSKYWLTIYRITRVIVVVVVTALMVAINNVFVIIIKSGFDDWEASRWFKYMLDTRPTHLDLNSLTGTLYKTLVEQLMSL